MCCHPPDVVCLYSEDQKFFLYSELYCALSPYLKRSVASRSPDLPAEDAACVHRIGGLDQRFEHVDGLNAAADGELVALGEFLNRRASIAAPVRLELSAKQLDRGFALVA